MHKLIFLSLELPSDTKVNGKSKYSIIRKVQAAAKRNFHRNIDKVKRFFDNKIFYFQNS